MRAARLDDVRTAGRASVRVAGHSLALFFHDGRVYAVDNRCPHMGFPLHRGAGKDGILTCHWHHARFDLATGGTFDPFADDARAFPVEVEGGEVVLVVGPADGRIDRPPPTAEGGMEGSIPVGRRPKPSSPCWAAGEITAAFSASGSSSALANRAAGWG